MDSVISQIPDYARRENLNAAKVKQLFDVGIVAKGVLGLAAKVRNLTPDEIAALDIDTVAQNNSASLEELVRNQASRTSTHD